ncbi:MAG: Holliday junction resolvase RuvX [Bacteriovoracaceae bacterium]
MNEFHLPTHHPLNLKNILAMDFGEKFIGVATYGVNRDPYPTPYGRIQNKSEAYVLSELKKILDDECIDIIVIGLPHLTDGKKTAMTEKAQAFVNFIREKFSLVIEEQDETLSTYEAESRMKSSPQYNFQVDYSQIDAVAASVILEDFIRRKKNNFSL